ncbi:neutral zinc metallopeptidase [Kribbella sp. NPDC059898]|uniref:neutral zinc metallopeptidase n=1 Tax=Kribbella sp. NPDC059898 TaxID=3346995 RepID=UPI00364B5E1E
MEETYLLYNEVYSAGRVQAVRCKLPDLHLRTQKDVQRYSDAVLDCLQRSWKSLVDRSDVVFTPTRVYAVARGARTGCGTFGKNDDAFYCPANDFIYLDWHQQVEESNADQAWAQTYLEFVMAHEFGHHVQQLVGISRYFDDRWNQATGAAQLEQMRRHELQATCFAAAWLGANQQTLDLYGERLSAYHDAAYVGDEDVPSAPHDHGSRKSSTTWSKAGFTTKSPAACNTWAAPAKRVS